MPLKKFDFVVIDLETTGIDPKKDQIIEFAGVQIKNGKIARKLELLINPLQEISPQIQMLTGITNEELVKQPTFSDVKEKIKNFIGKQIIVGHNIQFDLNFLQQNGLEFTQSSLDTYILSGIFFPAEKSLALEVLTESLQIEHQAKHRALGDVMATYELIRLIAVKISDLSAEKKQQIEIFLKKSNSILKEFFVQIATTEIKKEEDSQLSLFQNQMQSGQAPNLPQELQTDLTVILAQKQNALLEIPFQFQTVSALIQFLLQQKQAAVLAFYSPKLLRKVWRECSVETQKQITVLKNPQNYLCLEKWQNFSNKQNLSEAEINLGLKILIGLIDQAEGERDLINLNREEYQIWERALSADNNCNQTKNHSNCLWPQKKQKLLESPLILTYQNLLFEFPFPREKPIFVLEANDFDKTCNHLQQISVNWDDGLYFLKQLKLESELKIYFSQIQVLIDGLDLWGGHFTHICEREIANFSWGQKIVLTPQLNMTASFQELKTQLQTILLKLEEFLNYLKNFAGYQTQFNLLQIWQQHLLQFFTAIDPESVAYFQIFESGLILFKIEKIDLGNLSTTLLEQYRQIIFLDENLTTATKTNGQIESNFQYWKSNLGLAEKTWCEKKYPKPKTQKPNLDLNFLQQKTCTDFFNASCAWLREMIDSNQGKTVALFPNMAALQQYWEALALELQASGYRIIAQGAGGGNRKVKAIFEKFAEKSVLFGLARSFQREFFQPEHVKTLVLTKLIFDPPSDPLIQARQARYHNSFLEYALPRAILNLKQDFLKLQNDQQNFAVLDPRLTEKDYSQYFLKSLEEI